MEKIGRKIAKRCGRLPLAIVVMGGLLSTKNTTDEWEIVYGNMSSHLRGGNAYGGVMQVVGLSYKDLPYFLKPYFLYLGQFPEDSEISAERLVRKWVAKGIVSSCHFNQYTETERPVVDIEKSYLHELRGRCMVQLKFTRTSERLKSCRLHDLVHEFCLSKLSEQEYFLKLVRLRAVVSGTRLETGNFSTSTSSSATGVGVNAKKMRRLAMYNDDKACSTHTVDCHHGYQHVRSVSFFTSSGSFNSRAIKRMLKCFSLLRVLDFKGLSLGYVAHLPISLGKLMHLRFLSLKDTNFEAIPSCIGKLRSLQTLDLRVKRVLTISKTTWRTEHLRHLYLPSRIRTSSSLQIDRLNNLETLVNFNADFCDVKCISGLANLRELKAIKMHTKELGKILKSGSILMTCNNSSSSTAIRRRVPWTFLFSNSLGDVRTDEEQNHLRGVPR